MPGRPEDERALRRRGAGGARRGMWHLATGVVVIATTVGAVLGVAHIGVRRLVVDVLASNPLWLAIALSLTCLAMAGRAIGWHAILSAAMPDARIGLAAVLRATSIGILLSATLPARAGEAARAAVGRVGSFALAMVVPALVAVLALGPAATIVRRLTRRSRGRGWRRLQADFAQVRTGLASFRSPRRARAAIAAQLGAWGLQWLSCYALLRAFGLEPRAGVGAAAAVLFAVNVTAAVPVTPANVGVFQAACVAVLAGAYGLRSADALAYGIVLHAVELATAIVMGAPALLHEGLTWRDVRDGPRAPGGGRFPAHPLPRATRCESSPA